MYPTEARLTLTFNCNPDCLLPDSTEIYIWTDDHATKQHIEFHARNQREVCGPLPAANRIWLSLSACRSMALLIRRCSAISGRHPPVGAPCTPKCSTVRWKRFFSSRHSKEFLVKSRLAYLFVRPLSFGASPMSCLPQHSFLPLSLNHCFQN